MHCSPSFPALLRQRFSGRAVMRSDAKGDERHFAAGEPSIVCTCMSLTLEESAARSVHQPQATATTTINHSTSRLVKRNIGASSTCRTYRTDRRACRLKRLEPFILAALVVNPIGGKDHGRNSQDDHQSAKAETHGCNYRSRVTIHHIRRDCAGIPDLAM